MIHVPSFFFSFQFSPSILFVPGMILEILLPSFRDLVSRLASVTINPEVGAISYIQGSIGFWGHVLV